MVPQNRLNRLLLKNCPGLQFKHKSYWPWAKYAKSQNNGWFCGTWQKCTFSPYFISTAHTVALHKNVTEAENVVGPAQQTGWDSFRWNASSVSVTVKKDDVYLDRDLEFWM